MFAACLLDLWLLVVVSIFVIFRKLSLFLLRESACPSVHSPALRSSKPGVVRRLFLFRLLRVHLSFISTCYQQHQTRSLRATSLRWLMPHLLAYVRSTYMPPCRHGLLDIRSYSFHHHRSTSSCRGTVFQ